jgi:hypothetical protein
LGLAKVFLSEDVGAESVRFQLTALIGKQPTSGNQKRAIGAKTAVPSIQGNGVEGSNRLLADNQFLRTLLQIPLELLL